MTDRDCRIPSNGSARRLLRLREVSHRVGLARSTIYRWIDEDRFPKPLQLGSRTVVWPDDVIDAWIADKIANGLADRETG